MRPSFVTVSALLLCLASTANGTEATVDFTLDFAAAGPCPSETDFLAALRARLPRARRVADGAPVAQIHVHVASGEEGGEPTEVVVALPDGASLRRELPPASCMTTVNSVAFIAAMALEGNLDASATPIEQSAERTEATNTPAGRTEKPTGAASTPIISPRKVASAQGGTSWHAAVIGGAGAEAGMSPALAPAVIAGAELEPDGARFLNPSLRISALFAERSGDVSSFFGARAKFRLLAARGELCPQGVRSAPWAATLCAVAEYGTLTGSASQVEGARDQSMRWLGLGLAVHGDARLSRSLSIGLTSAARALEIHDRFTFSPGILVYQVPNIAGDLLIELKLTWH